MDPFDDFVWCPVRWDGPGGRYDLSGADVIKEHICAQHQPGHTTHVCCCGAIKEED